MQHADVLQVLLLHVLRAIQTYIERDRQYREQAERQYSVDLAMRPGAPPRSPSHAARAAQQEAAELAAQAQRAAAAEHAVHALVERGVVLRCVDVCECLLRLRQHGTRHVADLAQAPSSMPGAVGAAGAAGEAGTLPAQLEQLALRCAVELLICSSEALRFLSSPSHHHQFEFLASMLGWPPGPEPPAPALGRSHPGTPRRVSSAAGEGHSVAQRAAGEALRAPGDELALQLLVLQAWQPLLW